MSTAPIGLRFKNKQVYEDIITYANNLIFYLNQDMVFVLEQLHEFLPRETWINFLTKMNEWIKTIR